MSLDEITVKDGNYGTVSYDSRLKSNRIPTRETSFMKIKNYWDKVRRQRLVSKLEKEKKELVSTGYEGSKEEIDSKIYKKSAVIARLEKDIDIIDKKTIPVNYVKRRAILIKNAMSTNLIDNGYNAYFVTKTASDSVFDKKPGYGQDDVIDVKQVSNEISETVKSNVAASINKKEQEVTTQPIDEAKKDVEPVNREEIEKQINSYLSSIKESNKQISEKIDNKEDKSEDEQKDEFKMDKTSIEKIVNSKLSETVAEVSKERDEYVPLTDEEIEEARKKLGITVEKKQEPVKNVDAAIREAISKVGLNIYKSEPTALIKPETAVRDDVFVAPDRKESKDSMKAVVTEVAPSVVKTEESSEVVDSGSEKAKLVALMNRLTKLEEDKRKAEADREAAQKVQVEENKKAAETRKALISKQEAFKLRASKLEQKCSLLEEDILDINKSAKVARDDAECNSRFVKSQEREIQSYDEMMKEIDSIIGVSADEEAEVKVAK